MTLEKATKSAGRGSPRRQDGEDDTKEEDDEEVQKEDNLTRGHPHVPAIVLFPREGRFLNFGGTRKNTQTIPF